METSPGGTKVAILELLTTEQLSAAELADRLGLTAAAIRQHLAPLFATGLVDRDRVVTGPQRPTDVYRLTDEGRRTFPKRYATLLANLIEALEERYGPAALLEVLDAAARRFAAAAAGEFAGLPPAQRWERLVAWLETEFAWRAKDERGGDLHRVLIHHCPFQEVSANHPVVCGRFFGTVIREIYGPTDVRHEGPLERPACCALIVEALENGEH